MVGVGAATMVMVGEEVVVVGSGIGRGRTEWSTANRSDNYDGPETVNLSINQSIKSPNSVANQPLWPEIGSLAQVIVFLCP